jgi:KDO2-lipid IV(A) lauroyltransferase
MMRWWLNTISRWAARWSRPTQLQVGRTLGFIMGRMVRMRRRAVLATLARCLPERTDAERRIIANGVYRHLGTMAVECLGFPGQPREVFQQHVDFVGEEHMPAPPWPRAGVCWPSWVTSATGNCSAWPWPNAGCPSPSSCAPSEIPSSTPTGGSRAKKWACARCPAQHSYREALRVLKKGEMVAVTLDQNMRRRRGIFVNFFGEQACTTPGLAYLAAHSGAPVVPLYIIRQPDGRHVVHAQPALPPPPDREEATILAATQTYSNILENIIRQHPDQWLWLHNRWRTRPEQPVPPSRTQLRSGAGRLRSKVASPTVRSRCSKANQAGRGCQGLARSSTRPNPCAANRHQYTRSTRPEQAACTR